MSTRLPRLLQASLFALALVGAISGVARMTAQQPAATKAFTGLRLLDGTGRAPIANATLIVRDGRVVTAGPAANVNIPAGADRVVLAGKTVVPGLINAHGHVNDAARDLRTYAVHGVTTVVSLGNENAETFAARKAQATPTLDRARVFVAGTVLAPTTVAEARQQVAENERSGADWVKIRVDDNLGTTPKMAPDVYRAVIDEAHKRGRRVAAHLFYLADAKGLLDAGVDLLAHSVRDANVDSALISSLKARDICVCPTLMREVSTYVYESTPAFFSDPLFLKYADAKQVEQRRQPAQQEALRKDATAQRYKTALEVASRNLKTLSDAGVPIAMSTDTGPAGRFQGYFELMEMELMAKAGMTPGQVLHASTLGAARCMGLDKELGTLEPGRWADFVVLDADPLADISSVKKISDVYVAGNRVSR